MILFIIIGLSIGYSSLSTKTSITEIAASIRIEKDIRITGISVFASESNGVSNYEEYNVSNISAGIYLPNSDSSVTYKISITNFESPEVVIFDINNLPENLDYELSNYTLKDKVCDINNKCNLGITKDIYITIKYKENRYNSSTTTYNVNLKFDFRKIYQVSYTNIDKPIEESFEGESFTVALPYDTSSLLKITMGENILVSELDYTYDTTTKTLTIPNVQGNINIEYTFTRPIVLLYDMLVPIVYNVDHWEVADTNSIWYDYDNQQWANAVILRSNITKNVGDTVTVDGDNPDAKAMFVWIPRYEYKIDGNYGIHTNGTEGIATLPGKIEINFIPKEQITETTGYKIHPAFTFNQKQISGIWIGKFETSHSSLSSSTEEGNLNCKNENCSNADGLVILPNISALTYNNVSNFFYAARSMSRNENPFGIDSSITDTHMMKNSEWGAVAYLTQSRYGKYGNEMYTGTNKEIYQNKSLITGKSNGTPSQDDAIENQCSYNDIVDRKDGTGSCGGGASTTGNITGIYDMSGGANEYVMGYLTTASTTWGSTSGDDYAKFASEPSSKYFDAYTSTTSSVACNGSYCYGHALDEVSGWYSDSVNFVSEGSPWTLRGGGYDRGIIDGVFYYSRTNGSSSTSRAFRIVITEP